MTTKTFDCPNCGASGEVTLEDTEYYDFECCPCCSTAIEYQGDEEDEE